MSSGFLAAKGCAPAPDGAEPPELTIRRLRGDTDAELYAQLLDYWREERATVRALQRTAHLEACHQAEIGGHSDYHRGKSLEDCPHLRPGTDGMIDSDLVEFWSTGFANARYEEEQRQEHDALKDTVRALREQVDALRVSLKRLLWDTQKHVDDDTVMCACCHERSYPWRRYHHKDYCPFALLNEEAPDATE
jgi:cytochrome c553